VNTNTTRCTIGAVELLAISAIACGSVRNFDESATGGGSSGGAQSVAPGSSGGASGSGSQGASGGAVSADAGGKSAQGGNAAAGSSSNVSKATACVAYAIASCLRSQECAGREPDVVQCLRLTGSACPDQLFTRGSKRTVDEAVACAGVLRSRACDDDGSTRPACMSPGEFAEGARCDFGTQCRSLHCLGSGACGVCAKVVSRGQACGEDLGTACTPGNQCSKTNSGICVDPKATVGLGRACGVEKCESGLTCYQAVCVRPLEVGDECSTVPCKSPLYCAWISNTERRCVVLPHVGEPCRDDPTGACELTAECDHSTPIPTCRALPVAGQPCFNQRCASGFKCQLEPVQVCVAAPTSLPQPEAQPRGSICSGQHAECAANTMCLCADPQCSVRSCAVPGLEAEPCGTPDNACFPAFECIANICRPRESQGLFESACGPP